MTKVSIDVPALRDVANKLRTLASDANTQVQFLRGACNPVPDPAEQINLVHIHTTMLTQYGDQTDDRVDLAVIVNGGDEGAMNNGPVEYDIPSDTSTGVQTAIGTTLADYFEDFPSDSDDGPHADIREMDRYLFMLQKHETDANVTNAMFESLGPEGTANFPQQLANFYDEYERSGMQYDPEGPMWDDNTHMLDRIRQLQDGAMNTFSNALTTSSNNAGFDPEFGRKFAEMAQQGGPNAWAVSEVLQRGGSYGTEFLNQVGDSLDAYERGENGRPNMWRDGLPDDYGRYSLGVDHDTRYFDPMVGLMEALGRNAEASQDFFRPPDGEQRSEYYLKERSWDDEFNSVAEALDAGATGFRNVPPGERDIRSAQLASDMMYLTQREGDPKIGDAGKDSLGHILSTYIADVDRSARGNAGEPGVNQDNRIEEPWLRGLPPGANFDQGMLRTLMQEVMTDDDAVRQVANASNIYNQHRFDSTSQAVADGTADRTALSGASNSAAQMQGFILGAMGQGREDQGEREDQRAQMYVDLTADIVDTIPIPGGDFVGFLADQAKSQGKDFASDAVTGNQAEQVNQSQDREENARHQLEVASVQSAAEHGLLDDPRYQQDAYGNTYPWFVNGQFDADVATSSENMQDFIQYAQNGNTGVEDLKGQVQAGWTTGVNSGRG